MDNGFASFVSASRIAILSDVGVEPRATGSPDVVARPVANGGPCSFLGWLAMTRSNRTDHIRLTSHPDPGAKHRFPIKWGAPTARERGPIIGTVSRPHDRNVIGSHGGS